MLLHKYTGIAGKDIVFNARLKVSDPNSFNDPFELALNVLKINPAAVKKYLLKNKPVVRQYFDRGITTGRIKESWKGFRKRISDPTTRDNMARDISSGLNGDFKGIFNQRDGSVTAFFMLCCFCGPPLRDMDEVLMWAHYSEGLRGLRFSMESELLNKKPIEVEKVRYQEKIVTMDPVGLLTRDREGIRESLGISLGTKSKAWEYEQEWRWFVDKRICKEDEKSKEWFVPIDLKAIKRIDFGEKCRQSSIDEISAQISTLKLEIELKKAIPSAIDFKLNYIDL